MMYRLFLENYADESELDNYTGEDGQIIYRSISANEIEVKKTSPRKGRYRAALILYDSFDKSTRSKWIDLFKNGRIDLLIVFQMLQTGFDAPRLKKLYLHRMVKEHNLLQTLTRVNRPYKAMKFGHVVDFANIEEEYSKTHKDYQEELEKEVGQKHTSSMDRLFVTIEEAMRNVADAKVTLADYDLTNPQIFSRQLNLVDDLATVRSVNKSLEILRSMQNMLISQESPEVKKIVDIPEISNFIKAARNRLDLLSYEQNSNDRESVKQLLNAALENIHFSFYKKGEEELELQEQYRQSVAHTRNQLNACVDPDDPEYRSILADFLALFKKKEMESEGEFNMHDRVQNINGILKRIRQMNERDALKAIAYNGDTKFVRIEKRLTEQADREEREHTEPRTYAWTKKKEQVTAVLLLIKEDVDDAFFHNEAIVETPAYFTKNILTYVTRRFKEAQISTARPARKYVSDIIFKEYQTIY